MVITRCAEWGKVAQAWNVLDCDGFLSPIDLRFEIDYSSTKSLMSSWQRVLKTQSVYLTVEERRSVFREILITRSTCKGCPLTRPNLERATGIYGQINLIYPHRII